MNKVGIRREDVEKVLVELLAAAPEELDQPNMLVHGVAHLRLGLDMLVQASATPDGIERLFSDMLDEVVFQPGDLDADEIDAEDDTEDNALIELWESTARRWGT